MTHPRPTFVPALLVLLATGCAGFGEAMDDRLGAVEGDAPTLRLVARGEGEGETAHGDESSARAQRYRGPVRVVAAPSEGGQVVGELFSWHSITHPIPIVLAGDPSSDTLRRDVVARLHALGIEVAEAADSSDVDVLELDWRELWVQPTAARWNELRGRIDARAAFDATLRRDGSVLWAERCTGTADRRVTYFLTSDSEEVLGLAYGRALGAFVRAWPEPDPR